MLRDSPQLQGQPRYRGDMCHLGEQGRHHSGECSTSHRTQTLVWAGGAAQGCSPALGTAALWGGPVSPDGGGWGWQVPPFPAPAARGRSAPLTEGRGSAHGRRCVRASPAARPARSPCRPSGRARAPRAESAGAAQCGKCRASPAPRFTPAAISSCGGRAPLRPLLLPLLLLMPLPRSVLPALLRRLARPLRSAAPPAMDGPQAEALLAPLRNAVRQQVTRPCPRPAGGARGCRPGVGRAVGGALGRPPRGLPALRRGLGASPGRCGGSGCGHCAARTGPSGVPMGVPCPALARGCGVALRARAVREGIACGFPPMALCSLELPSWAGSVCQPTWVSPPGLALPVPCLRAPPRVSRVKQTPTPPVGSLVPLGSRCDVPLELSLCRVWEVNDVLWNCIFA